jgi:hypothetical protein
MKEKLILILKKQKETGIDFNKRLETISSTIELEKLLTEYEEWNKNNCEILDKAYVHKQLYRMYSGVKYLGNVHTNNNVFQANRDKILHCLPVQLGHLNTAIAHTQDIRNTDLLPFDEQLTIIKEKPTKILSMKKLFISHASEDKEKIKPLIDLIEGIGVSENQIFYSSLPAFGVSLGENIFDRLKKELEGEVFALFILSPNFYKSPVCLCEMGAVWIKSNKQIPILIPPFEFDDVKGVFPNSLGFKINDKFQLNSLKIELEKYFDLTPKHLTRWEEKREKYISEINNLIITDNS